MDKITLDPYLFFQGNCREAMEFYRGIFGGELSLQTYDEVPKEALAGMPGADDMKGKIMHAHLQGDFNLYGSDTPKASAKAAKVDLTLGGSDEPKLRKFFEGLSEGGQIIMSLEKQFWGDISGMAVDKFGIEWMVNISAKKE